MCARKRCFQVEKRQGVTDMKKVSVKARKTVLRDKKMLACKAS